ncbi:MAG TPA: YggT family protein [Rhizomicrobium sp.]|jgi:YggT family protein|nr:YggT family protein [Rhizomicrobium sp.]
MPNPIVWLLLNLIDVYVWVVIVAVVASWLIAFGVVNLHNQFVRRVVQIIDALTEPVFRQVRRIVPPIGGLDLSPLIVIFGLYFIRYLIVWLDVKFALS